MKTGVILVIEDNEVNAEIVVAMLESAHYKVHVAGDAETGIELCRSIKPDLVLMDIQLPGMDGLSATRIIKSDKEMQNVPVVAVSAYAMESDVKMALEAGCSEFISKPFGLRACLDCVAKYVK